MATTPQQQQNASFRAGDTVYTCYGAGVIVSVVQTIHDICDGTCQVPTTDTDPWYTVRLWRLPNRSVGSAALAKLKPSAILTHLPVAPGMCTFLKTTESDGSESSKKLVMVHCYYRCRNTFLVEDYVRDSTDDLLHSRDTWSTEVMSGSINSIQFVEIASEQLSNVAPSAKFYPILESLMDRADQAASAFDQILRSDTSKKVVESTGRVIQNGVEQIVALGRKNDVEGDNSLVSDIELVAKKTIPEIEENMKMVMTMMKDKEITMLLHECKNRLDQLTITELSDVTRKVLEKGGIYIQLNDIVGENSNFSKSRETALVALHDLMQYTDMDDLTVVRNELANKFANAFDSLSKAAKSDRSLDKIFGLITDKTAVWQEATGRIMSTRSAGLFMEGATRIQARVAAIFGNGQFQVFGEMGSKLMKSFTERDAALARLKSIELGDAVKTRLVRAIEVRSESLGGLDGIIVGALSTIKNSGDAQHRIPHLLQTLQQNATSITTNSHETLISLLSSRSSYRDQALLRLEKTFCDLSDQMGDDLSLDDVAAIVRGEGGTAKIFEPIARRAMKQIEKQLDTAESQVTDTTTISVLSRIRKITSGEMTVAAILDDIVNVLNDDAVVSAGESFVRQSEQVFDVIEGISANRAVTDAIQIAEKAGITKETVMREFEKLKVDDILGAAEKAVTDAKARRKLLSTATDVALDFVLRILPSMPVPPFEGVKDGLVYHISNLSMKGFKVKKEDIQIELAGMRATQHPNKKILSMATDLNGRSESHSLLQKTFSEDSEGSELEIDDVHRPIKASELLIIDIKNTSAVLENAIWNFEQTYLPYLSGGGIANVKMSGGSIKLQFELRKRRKNTGNSDDPIKVWEPVLCLHNRSCTISEVELSLEGDNTLTWLINKIATIFKTPLRDYVVSTIVKVLSNRSGWILEKLNKILLPYWDLILRTANLDLDNLLEADDDVIVSETISADHSFIELVWRERLPLGMNLLMNDDSGLLKVVDFPRGSQARVVCERRGFDSDAFKGATIVAVNGTQYDDQEELFEVLKHAGRPKTIRFRLADTEDAERLRKFLDTYKTSPNVGPTARDFRFRKALFLDESDLGIEFKPSVDSVGLVVSGFVEAEGGIVLAAERSGIMTTGDLLTHINDHQVLRPDGGDGLSLAMKLLESSASVRPLSLTFTEPYIHTLIIEKMEDVPGVDCIGGIDELVLTESIEGDRRRILINGFTNVSGMAERCGILIGDHLVFVNGLPVGAGCRWLDTPSTPTLKEVLDMLNNDAFYPIGLTFARRQLQKASRWSLSSGDFSDADAETICVTASSQAKLGILLNQMDNGDITVSDFQGVAGVVQSTMEKFKNKNGCICLAVDSINGQFVPSYASVDLVRNALKRSWTIEKTTQLILCDNERKEWLFSNLKK